MSGNFWQVFVCIWNVINVNFWWHLMTLCKVIRGCCWTRCQVWIVAGERDKSSLDDDHHVGKQRLLVTAGVLYRLCKVINRCGPDLEIKKTKHVRASFDRLECRKLRDMLQTDKPTDCRLIPSSYIATVLRLLKRTFL